MQKLALGAFTALLFACGGNNDTKVHIVTDSGSGSDATCNPLAQTGCNTGEKCTWIYDLVSADGTNVLGHVGCAPDGDKAVAAQCTRNAAGAQGYDDCAKGGFCKAKRELIGPGGTGVCEAVCDNNGGAPMCSADSVCVSYHNIFEVSAMNVAGVCDKKCDPFADNDFLHTGSGNPSRPGTQCQPYEGCYGGPGDTTARPTAFSCAREYNTDLHHRDECTATSGNSNQAANPLSRVGCSTASNGCSEGYTELFYEDTSGSMIVTCTAMCKPASCWMGHCGGATTATSNIAGDPASGHTCTPASILGTFEAATIGAGGVNGNQCYFSWRLQFDGSGNFFSSPNFDNSVGWCEQHDQYKYDVNGDGMITSVDETEPKCDTLADPTFGTGSADGSGNCTYENGCRGAASFGCTSMTDAQFTGTFQGKHPDLGNIHHAAFVRPRL